jgi:hypothetical protein
MSIFVLLPDSNSKKIAPAPALTRQGAGDSSLRSEFFWPAGPKKIKTAAAKIPKKERKSGSPAHFQSQKE